jgi:cell division protein FtsX
MADLIVMPSEVSGWDVIREHDPQALTNTATMQAAVLAAEVLAADEGGGSVRVDERHTHKLDDTSRGVRTYVVALLGLLLAVVVIIVVTSLLASWTIS